MASSIKWIIIWIYIEVIIGIKIYHSHGFWNFAGWVILFMLLAGIIGVTIEKLLTKK